MLHSGNHFSPGRLMEKSEPNTPFRPDGLDSVLFEHADPAYVPRTGRMSRLASSMFRIQSIPGRKILP